MMVLTCSFQIDHSLIIPVHDQLISWWWSEHLLHLSHLKGLFSSIQCQIWDHLNCLVTVSLSALINTDKSQWGMPIHQTPNNLSLTTSSVEMNLAAIHMLESNSLSMWYKHIQHLNKLQTWHWFVCARDIVPILIKTPLHLGLILLL
jgi:hypothetical protein